jgi:hypothetical protein
MTNLATNVLYYGDNLDILRTWSTAIRPSTRIAPTT